MRARAEGERRDGGVGGGGCAAFLCADDVVDDGVGDAELADLLLHGVLEDGFLADDQGPLLLVVGDAGCVFAPVAAPPVAPGVAAGGALVCAGVVALFVVGGALGAGPQAGALVPDDGDETAATEDPEGDLQGNDVGCLALLGTRWELACGSLVRARLCGAGRLWPCWCGGGGRGDVGGVGNVDAAIAL